MNNSLRHFSLLDRVLIQIDNCFAALNKSSGADRAYPAQDLPEPSLTPEQKKQSAGFMRVNHTGEICAQALYNAQGLMAHEEKISALLSECGQEEGDHLVWCQERLRELSSHPSYLNFFWYWNSFFIGVIAGLAGDKWSLGFVEETEIQVNKHLQNHLDRMVQTDEKSIVIIKQMQIDEARHAKTACEHGAKELPTLIKKLMSLQSKVMTTLTYWI